MTDNYKRPARIQETKIEKLKWLLQQQQDGMKKS
jgi:hypothetical protein